MAADARSGGAGVLASVSTVKDTPRELERFVRWNLQRCLDHMFVILDGAAPEAAELLGADPHVTVVEATAEWWGEHRPPGLNRRQSLGANLVKAVLTTCPSVDWLFHIDSDEVVDVDRARLEAADGGTRALALGPCEVISQRRRSRGPAEFKRPLDEPELALLHSLGVMPHASNAEYFHGHLAGKAALRPTLDLALTIHKVVDPDGEVAEALEADWLRVLHLHTPSRADFVRRWGHLLSSGPLPGMRPGRSSLAAAVATLSELDLPRPARERYLTRLYDQTTADPVDVLRDLRLLETIDLDRQVQEPGSIPAAELAQVEHTLAGLQGVDKRVFGRGTPAEVQDVLDRARG